MPECPHGQEPGIHCPPCHGTVGHRLPAWQLVRRQPAMWPTTCRGCRQHITADQHAAFWTDGNIPGGRDLAVTCALCHPTGRHHRPPLEPPRRSGANPPCPACDTQLVEDRRMEYRAGRMKPALDPRPARCPSCRYVDDHQEHQPERQR